MRRSADPEAFRDLHRLGAETPGSPDVGSLAEDGRIVAVDFVPNEDRVSPPFPAAFSWEMLASTPAGQAYTQSELTEMGRLAGRAGVRVKPMPPTPASLIVFK